MTDEEKELIDRMCNDAADTIKQLQEENQRLTARLQRQAETIDDFQKGLGKFIDHPTGAIPHFGYAEKYLNDLKAENQRLTCSYIKNSETTPAN